jgi:GNAT superfamily N-acetyltransferase
MPTPIRQLTVISEAELAGLAALLVDAVDGGAAVGFLAPLAPERALRFWRGIAADVAAGDRVLLVAEDDAGIVGTVQLGLALPDNQPHRADLAKMLVHRRSRRQGLGARLLAAAEKSALAHGRTLLVLDAVPDRPGARLYERAGWTPVGVIPGFAHNPDGSPGDTMFFYRDLGQISPRVASSGAPE